MVSKPKLSDYVSRVPVTASTDQTVAFARLLMVEHKIRHLPVLRGDAVVGVFSQRDMLLLDAITDGGEVSLEKAMVGDPYVVDINDDLATVANEMAARRLGSAVVVDAGEVVAMFTTVDALRALAAALS